MNETKPIDENLTKEELLERCIGVFTQNSNESCNQIICKVTPKSLPASSTIVNMAVKFATCTFNEKVQEEVSMRVQSTNQVSMFVINYSRGNSGIVYGPGIDDSM
ncbi:unnamed protein product [Euphydryas editha]|uniref:Dynein light chain n=1 Tax=Euphydryas editha TaxID=104508 RepID=A0AAU9U113_EUPED|nr:unnamed protein product [Euphydryas editha]